MKKYEIRLIERDGDKIKSEMEGVFSGPERASEFFAAISRGIRKVHDPIELDDFDPDDLDGIETLW